MVGGLGRQFMAVYERKLILPTVQYLPTAHKTVWHNQQLAMLCTYLHSEYLHNIIVGIPYIPVQYMVL